MTVLDAISHRHTKWKKPCSVVLTVFTLFLTFNQSLGCPTEVQRLCGCVDELDGVLLNCSNVDAVDLLQVLRAQQSQLGLLKALSIQHSSPIGVLPPNFFAGLYIKRLELVNCGIRTVENGAFSGLEPVLQELNMANNLLSNIPVAAIASMNSVLKLDFSNNSIEELKQEDALPRLPKLFDINLSHNLISNVHKSFFENAKGSLQTINLGHNNITEVPAPALRGFRQLMALHLHNNNLHSIQMLSFMNLPLLSLLNLASNKISSIHKQAFLNTPTLRFLYMTDNHLTEVVAHQFSSFEQLEMIDLSSNRIEVLHNDSFSNLASVRQIYLGENRISKIEDYAFANSSVVILVLEANHLTEVRKGMFQGCTKVQQISLKDNKIKSVDPNAFYNNGALVMVDLSHNELFDLSPATFLSQLNMLLVDLSYNKLLRTPYSAFNRRVVTVLLKENPLVCSEKVHMLQQGVGVYVPNSEDIICRRQHSIGSSVFGEVQAASNDSRSNVGGLISSSPFSSLPQLVKSVETEESGAFVQGPASPTESPAQQLQNSDRQHSLVSNIRPISTKRISTADINQFVDTSQFPDSISQPTVDFSQHTSPSNTPIIQPLEDHHHTQPPSPAPQPSSPNPTTTSNSSSSHEEVDIANDPNQIYPLPVPFLTRPPKIHTAHNVGNDVVVTQTLPPSIVIAAGPPRTAFKPAVKKLHLILRWRGQSQRRADWKKLNYSKIVWV
uniref:Uncharacterized protein n=1 Tax=Ditylenchus dipsaci TaxID=166011 RepID=A0A915EDZ2_9BILA